MKDSFVEKVKLIFLNPHAFWKQVKEESIEPAMKTYVYALAISVIFSSLPLLFREFQTTFRLVVTNFFSAIISIFVIAGIVHLLVIAFKGRSGFRQTFKVLAYAAVPASLLSMFLTFILNLTGNDVVAFALLLPHLLIFIYVFILEVLGLKALQRLSTTRAFLALIIPVLVLILLIGAIIAMIGSAL